MGLDMYLDKAKKIGDVTAKDILKAENYLEYLLRPSKYLNCSLKKWCGIPREEIDMDIVDNYRSEFKTRYCGWDTQHKYGSLRLFEGVGYWRKANEIHNWFVKNVQDSEDDCGMYEVSEDKLVELLNVCKEVKHNSKIVKGRVCNGESYKDGKWVTNYIDGEIIEDPSVAEELLPTTSGFFFGSTNYDQYYMQDIDYTIELLTNVLEETDFENEIVVYSSSW